MNLLKILFALNNFCMLYEGDPNAGGGDPDAGGGDPDAGGGDPNAGGGDPSAGGGDPNASEPFYKGFQDQNLAGWAEAKGLQDVEALARSAFNAEKMIGAPADQMARIPKADDAEGMKQLFGRLGMPDTADKYQIHVPEGASVPEDVQEWLKETFHGANLTQGQADKIQEAMHARDVAQNKAIAEGWAEDSALGVQALQEKWGEGYERQMALAGSAAQKLGFTEAMINSMQYATGYQATVEFMANLGKMLGEDTFLSGEQEKQGFHSQMTPAEAKGAWEALQGDANFMKALNDGQHPGHKDALERKKNLYALMYPVQ